MQIIDDMGMGGRLGASLGTGLQQIAQNKLAMLLKPYEQQVERSQYAKGLTPLLGQQTASFLSNLNPEERKYALQNLSGLMQLQGQPASALQALQQPQQQHLKEGQPQEQMPSDRAKLIQDIFTSPHERREEEKLNLRRQQLEQQEKQAAFKETKPERKEILASSKSAKENLARLNRMQELSNKGQLNNPLYIEGLKKFGLDIPALTTPDSQEFRKLETDFLRDAKNIFGARVTNFEMSQFLKSIPSLSQSKEGRERVIRNLKIFNEAALARSKAMKEIVKENKGVPPFDLMEKLDEKLSPRIDKLMEDFRKGTATVEELPNPAQYKDRKIRNTDTGKILQSDGKEWKEIS